MCEYDSWDGVGAMIDILLNQKKNIAKLMHDMQLDITLRKRANKWYSVSYIKERKAIADKQQLVNAVLIEGADIIQGIELAISSRVILTVMQEMNEKAIEFESKYRHLALIHLTLNR